MNISQLAALLAAFAGFVGVIWTIYNGRKTLKQKQTSSLMDDAVKIINSYKDDSARKDREIQSLRGQVKQLTTRLAKVERALAKAYNMPVNLLDELLEHPPDAPPPPALHH